MSSAFQIPITFFKLNRLLGTSQNKIRIFCYNTTQWCNKNFFTSNLKSSFRVIKQRNKKFEKAVNGEMILFKLCKLPADESTGWKFGNMALRDKTHKNLCVSSFCSRMLLFHLTIFCYTLSQNWIFWNPFLQKHF